MTSMTKRFPKSADVVLVVDEFPTLSETFILDQIQALVSKGIDLRIVAHARGTGVHVQEKARSLASRVTYIEDRFRMPQWIPRRLRSRLMPNWLVRRAYRDELGSAKLIICHFGPVGLRAARGLADVSGPRLWTIFHGYDLSKHLKRFGGGVYRSLFARGDRFLAVSRLWMARLKEIGCPPDRISLMRMGIDPEAITYAPRRYSPEAPFRLLSVGRLVEKKGTETALRAVAELSRIRPELDWSFEIVGDGPLRSSLEQTCRELQLNRRVSFSGPRSTEYVKLTLSQVDAFLLPSVTGRNGDMEGIPVALMEAMAAGVPVLSTYHSGIPELVDHGVTGLLAPEKDHVQIAENICRLIDEPALSASLTESARRKVEREFNQASLWGALAGEIQEELT